MDTYPQIRAILSRLPTLNCQKKCSYCCTGIKVTPVENRHIKRVTGTTGFPDAFKLLRRKEDPTCRFLDRECGLCTIHDDRPMICHMWGLTESMPCPEGCIPSRVLPDKEAHLIMTEIAYLGGELTHKEYVKHLTYPDDPEIWPLILSGMQMKRNWSEVNGLVWEIENKRGTL